MYSIFYSELEGSSENEKPHCQSESDEELDSGTLRLTPPLLIQEADEALQTLLVPRLSAHRYQQYFDHLNEWAESKGWPKGYLSENVLVCYFKHMTELFKPSSLQTRFSAIKKMMKAKKILLSFDYIEDILKKLNKSHHPKKAGVLSHEYVNRWLSNQQQDSLTIMSKLITLIAICGALRCQEVTNLMLTDIKEHEDYLVVNFLSSKTQKMRTFVCRKNENPYLCPLNYYKDYMARRKQQQHQRMWLGISTAGR